jgi:hypothetical protein
MAVLPMIAADNFGNSTAPGKDQRGRFQSGPGNTGRPRGSKNKQSAELMKVVRAMGPRAVEKLASALDTNERWAIELILKYCLPPSRTVEMEGLEPDDIKQAFISGDLTADESKALATTLEKLKNVADIDDLRERLTELETLLNAGK